MKELAEIDQCLANYNRVVMYLVGRKGLLEKRIRQSKDTNLETIAENGRRQRLTDRDFI